MSVVAVLPVTLFNFSLFVAFCTRVHVQSGAEVTAEVGGTFALFGGAVTGSFLEIEAPKSFVQQWRFASWGDEYVVGFCCCWCDRFGGGVSCG